MSIRDWFSNTQDGFSMPAMFEPLEPRLMLDADATVTGNLLEVVGTSAGEITIAVDVDGDIIVDNEKLTIPASDPVDYYTPADIDSITVAAHDGGNNIDLSGVSAGGGFALTSVIIDGGTAADTIIGSEFADTINGGGGNDTINGGDGDDTINGGDGDDIINGGAGDDILNGEAGIDTINGGDGNDTIDGGTGDDVLNGEAGDDIINGGAGDDTLTGGVGDDILDGGADTDTVSGGAGNDTETGENQPATSYVGLDDDMDVFLENLQLLLDNDVFLRPLPLIGDQLAGDLSIVNAFLTDPSTTGQFIYGDANGFADEIYAEFTGQNPDSATTVKTALVDALTPLGLIGGPEDITFDDTHADGDVSFTVLIHKDPTLHANDAAFILGTGNLYDANGPQDPIQWDTFSWLDPNKEKDVDITLGYDYTLTFALSEDGFYEVTSTANELTVDIEAEAGDLTNRETYRIGLLEAKISNINPGNPASFSGQYQVDVLPDTEIAAQMLNGTTSIELDIDGKFDRSDSSFMNIRSISEFHMTWDIHEADPADYNTLFGSRPDILVDNVKLDLDSFFGGFMSDIIERIQTYTKPLQPLIDVLKTELPVLNDLGLVITLESMLFGQDENNIYRQLIDWIDFVNAVYVPGEGAEMDGAFVDMGSFTFGDPRPGVWGIDESNPTTTSLATAEQLYDDRVTIGVGKAGFFAGVTPSSQDGMHVPILEDGTETFRLYADMDASLFEYQFPHAEASAGFEHYFSLIGPIGTTIGGSIGICADLTFGYDTYGLRKFQDGGSFMDILDGFYLDDQVTFNPDGSVAEDLPEFVIDAELGATLEFGFNFIVSIRAGVWGGIFGNIDFDVHDIPDPVTGKYDGRVRASELMQTAGAGATCIFDVDGALYAGLRLFVEVSIEVDFKFFSIEITLYDWSKNIVTTTLLDFSHACEDASPPPIATQDGTTLTLNTDVGDPYSYDDVYIISHIHDDDLGDGVEVSARGERKEFYGVDLITTDSGLPNFGTGEDIIMVLPNVTADAFFEGGVGDDMLIYMGTGSATLNGGAGDDKLRGWGGNDTLIGGAGNDLLAAGSGNDSLFGNEGDDKLSGDDGDDQLDGGSGEDDLDGGKGDDNIVGVDDDDHVTWFDGDGSDTISGGNPTASDTLTITGTSGNDNVTITAGGTGLLIDLPDGTTLDVSGIENIEIYLGAGADTLIINDLDDTGVNYIFADLGDLGAADEDGDTITVYATSADDTLTIESSSGMNADDPEQGHDPDEDLPEGDFPYEQGENPISQIVDVDGLPYELKIAGGSVPEDLLILDGADGDDTFIVTPGVADVLGMTLRGGAGDDTFIFEDGAVIFGQVDGGTGNDAIDFTAYTTDNTWNITQRNGGTIDATPGSFGFVSVENISGGQAADEFIISDGMGLDGVADGQDGIDTIDYADYSSAVRVHLAEGWATGMHGGFPGAVLNVENAIGGPGRDTLTGSDVVNVLTGNDGDDILIGGGGDDVLHGGAGNDTIYGNDGNDVLNGGDGDDTIYGDAGNDTLTSGIGDDTLYGGDGDDELVVGVGSEQLWGGAGIDTVDYSAGPGDMTISLLDGFVSNSVNVDQSRVWEIENVNASPFNDIVFGDAGDNVLVGGDGDDLLVGNQGNDELHGGAGGDGLDGGAGDDVLFGDAGEDMLDGGEGDDELHGGEDDDTLLGHAGNDVLWGDAGDDTLLGQADNDELHGGDGGDALDGGDGNDELHGDAGDDMLLGSTGADVLRGGADVDVLFGEQGDDILDGGADDDMADGGAGVDLLVFSGAAAGVNVDLAAGGGTDGLGGNDAYADIEGAIGTQFDDVLTGDAGANVFHDGAGDDVMNGGAGDDTYFLTPGSDDQITDTDGIDTLDFSGAASGITINLALDAGQAQQVDAALNTIAITGTIENVTGSDFADVLRGNASANKVLGGLGDDTLIGAGGDDRLFGDQGIDTADYSDAADRVRVVLYDNLTPRDGDGGSDKLRSIENVKGSAFADNIYGDAGVNVLWGNAGDDMLDGQEGADVLLGDVGEDLLIGHFGNDELHGGDGNDTLRGWAGNDVLRGDDGDDTLNAGSGDDELHGGGGNDLLKGQKGVDILRGDTGVDTLFGGRGRDTLDGGAGDDDIVGGRGVDLLAFSGAAAGVNVDLAAGGGTDGLGGNDTYADIEGAIGTQFDDVLTGDAGANVFHDEAGDDILNGGAGNDTYVLTPGSADQITDADGIDILDFSGAASGITMNLALDAGQAQQVDGVNTVAITGTIEHVTGSDFADVLKGNAVANRILGGLGDDTLIGAGGNDRLFGNQGIDTADYSDAADRVRVVLYDNLTPRDGDGGSDKLRSIENVKGSAFADDIYGDAGANVLWGNAGDDLLIGHLGADELHGGDGNDTLRGWAGKDVLRGDDGDDTLNAGNGDDELYGGNGNDLLMGRKGADILRGDAGVDTLFGGGGRDTLDGGAGDDDIVGGRGVDLLAFSGAAAGVNVDLAAGGGTDGLGGNDTYANVEGAIGTPFDDVLTGDAGANIFHDGAGDDILNGGAGDDTYVLTPGSADQITDADGIDTLDFSGAAFGITMNLALDAGQAQQVDAALNTVAITGTIENVTGSDFADVLMGNAVANKILGGLGDDTLIGAGGNDRLFGGHGIDTADYSDAADRVRVVLYDNLTPRDGDGGSDKLRSIENVKGSAFADDIYGDAGVNVLWGNSGDDMVDGQEGADVLLGDAGDDLLIGHLGNDELHGGDGNDTLRGWAGNDVLWGDDGDDTLLGQAGNDELHGGAGNDSLYGGGIHYDELFGGGEEELLAGLRGVDNLSGDAGDDTLYGGLGDDTLNGGAGNDTMYGGNGDDVLDGGADNDTLYGEEAADMLNGGDGNDTLHGGMGNDILDGWTGNDVLDGGGGDDRIMGWSGLDTITGDDGDDLAFGEDDDDLIDGGLGENALDAGSGDDTIDTTTGNNEVTPGYGNDTII